jgi:hypothetical protein
MVSGKRTFRRPAKKGRQTGSTFLDRAGANEHRGNEARRLLQIIGYHRVNLGDVQRFPTGYRSVEARDMLTCEWCYSCAMLI